MGRKKSADVVALEQATPDETVTAMVLAGNGKGEGINTDDEVIPEMTSPEWSDFIMKQFAEDEIFDGNPTVDGLRRLAEIYVGEIVESCADPIAWPGVPRDNTSATVKFTVVFKLDDGSFKKYAEVADVTAANTEELYRLYPSATASTRAEGRALRKALKLKRVVAAEEVKELSVEESEVSNEKISHGQVRYIKITARAANVDVIKFINSGSKTYKSYKDITFSTAAKMIEKLSEYKRVLSSVPDELKGYKEGWDQ